LFSSSFISSSTFIFLIFHIMDFLPLLRVFLPTLNTMLTQMTSDHAERDSNSCRYSTSPD
jgi:hypothetical protein